MWDVAKKEDKKLLTAADFLGQVPVVLSAAWSKRGEKEKKRKVYKGLCQKLTYAKNTLRVAHLKKKQK